MSQVIVVRHGETHLNHRGALVGTLDDEQARLTESGREQAQAVRELIQLRRFDAIYCSPLSRTRQTLDIITANRAHMPVSYDDRLREVDFGEFEGRPFRDLFADLNLTRETWLEHFWSNPFPGGESLEDCYKRVADFGAECAARDESSLLIVTHAVPLRMILTIMAGKQPAELLGMIVPPAAAFEARKQVSGQWSYKRIYPEK